MKVEKLKGHSGCDLFLYREKSNSFVRKRSPNKEYNSRLLEQCNKQIAWDSNISSTPAIIQSGYQDDLFYFDMEYILGSTVSSLLIEDQMDIDEIVRFVVSHFEYQYKEKKESSNVINSYSKKIEEFNVLKSEYPFIKNLNQALELLINNFSVPQYITKVHGDLTMENLVKSKKNNKIWKFVF